MSEQFSGMIYGISPEEEIWFRNEFNTDDWLLPCSYEFLVGSMTSSTLWLYSEDHFDCDALCKVIQRFIAKFRPDMTFRLTYACFSMEFLPSEFGGGWCVVNKENIVCSNTWKEAACIQNGI